MRQRESRGTASLRSQAARDGRPTDRFEAEVIPGLEPFAAAELAGIPGVSIGERDTGDALSGTLRFSCCGPWRELLALRTVVAVHFVAGEGLPRPTALLDDGLFRNVLATIAHIRSLHPVRSFSTFRVSAAGVESAVFRRFRERVVRETGLGEVDDGGDLLLRFGRRRSNRWGQRVAPLPREVRAVAKCATEVTEDRSTEGAFQLTMRISPRPLAARRWRVCNFQGALNATVASAMVSLTKPTADDVFLNLACGSATLLIERAAVGPAGRLIGCDVDRQALACGALNVSRAECSAELQTWDATATPLPDGSVDALAADLPFGQLVGSHRANERLYPALLAEAARVARPGARFAVITQQVNLFDRCVGAQGDSWSLERVIRIQIPSNAGTVKPRVYQLRRLA